MPIEPRTHLAISQELCGRPADLSPGRARVALDAVPVMAADARGLVHGGFAFGLADHAAMLAVNDPNVVLVDAEVRFLEPVVVGDRLEADASVERADGRRREVRVVVRRGADVVLEGAFRCHVPDRHVLDRAR